jgi:hypothetical protein
MNRLLMRATALLGVALICGAIALAVSSLASRDHIHPFSNVGWGNEQAVIALWLAALGGLLLRGAWLGAHGLVFVTALTLGFAAFLAEVRYWWPSLVLVCVAAFALAVAVAISSGWRIAFGIAVISLALFGGDLVIGSAVWAAQPRVTLSPSPSRPAPPPLLEEGCDPLAARLEEPARTVFTQALAAQPPELHDVFCNLVRADVSAGAGGQQLSDDIAFEAFRLDRYLTASVVPKRYLGFLDERGDTAAAETVLRETLEAAVPIANGFAEQHHLTARITEMEVAVTFLAEGGALLLGDGTDHLDRIHPVRDMGLDSFRSGFEEYRPLVDALDTGLGTRLGHLSLQAGNVRWLLRPMTFREAILGTAVMYLWEKDLCARLCEKEGRTLMKLALDEQFVTTSLLYNCGQLFSAERVAQIVTFSTGEYLAQLNVTTAATRPRLPLYAPAEARQRLIQGEGLPVQLTSWSAVVHVLQRYGAWAALDRQGRVFDDKGRFQLHDRRR